jgi:hypothetical protein
MHWQTAFVMDGTQQCLKNRLWGAYFGGKAP